MDNLDDGLLDKDSLSSLERRRVSYIALVDGVRRIKSDEASLF